MFPLRRQAVILGNNRPTVGQQSDVGFSGIDHRFDCKRHAFFKFEARSAFAVVQHLWLFVKDFADSVSAILAHHRKAVFFDVLLHGRANITEVLARSKLLNT